MRLKHNMAGLKFIAFYHFKYWSRVALQATMRNMMIGDKRMRYKHLVRRLPWIHGKLRIEYSEIAPLACSSSVSNYQD